MRFLVFLVFSFLATNVYAGKMVYNSTPAERHRDCVFAETFQSQTLVEQNEGTIFSAPTFSVKNGVDYDGRDDCISYNLVGNEHNSATLTWLMEFTPDFAATIGSDLCLFMTDDGLGTGLTAIFHDASDSEWDVYIADRYITSISNATMAAQWLQNQRNVIVMSSTSGDTSIFLNGVAILDSDATAWSPLVGTTRLIGGATDACTNPYEGEIHSFKIFQSQLILSESKDYYDRDIYTYMSSSTAHYRMRMQDHDVANARTLDSSGNNYHLTDNNNPTKLTNRHGYWFDGAVDFFYGGGANAPPGDFSVVSFLMFNNIAADVKITAANASSTSFGFALDGYDDRLFFSISDDGSGGVGHYSALSMSGAIRPYAEVVSAATYDYVGDGTSVANLYSDDMTPASSSTFDGPIYQSAPTFSIGRFTDAGGQMDGDIYEVQIYHGLVLTPMQIEDIKITFRKQRNLK